MSVNPKIIEKWREITARQAERSAESAVRLPRFAVVGAGHGGLAMAAQLAVRGFSVNLFSRSPQRIQPLRFRGGIDLEGPVSGFGELHIATDRMGAALRGVDVVMVVVPATGHREVARLCAPHLKSGQIVVLNPGRTGGALEFLQVLRENGNWSDVIVAEAQTFIYASRATGPTSAKIFGVKRGVALAALPAGRTQEVLETLAPAFPQFYAAESVLETSLDNMGAIFHPAVTILNSARIETAGGDFDYYHQGISPSVARILEEMDAERVAVAQALGVPARSAREWLGEAYDARGETLLEAVRNNQSYAGIKAPTSLDHRYIFEDVPASLVPIASLGEHLGVPVPVIRSIIQLASVIHRIDYWSVGRTVERLGLKGLCPEGIRRLAMEGVS